MKAIQFIAGDSETGDNISFSNHNMGETWDAQAEAFLYFLRAQGFILDSSNLAEYYEGQL